MHAWHPWLRKFVHWRLPHASACRAGLKRAREMVNKVVEKRRQEIEAAKLKGEESPTYYDALAWTLENPAGNDFEPGDVQLALAMAALFTTTSIVIPDKPYRPNPFRAWNLSWRCFGEDMGARNT